MRTAVAIPTNPDTANLTLWAKAVLIGGEDIGAAAEFAKHRNMPERVLRALNAPMMTTDGDMDGLANSQQILTSFAPLLRNSSAFFRLLDGLMIKLPMRTRLSYLTGAATMAVVGQAQVIQVSRMISDNLTIDPVKAVGIVVFSDEMLKWISAGGEAFLSMELRRAISAAVDEAFFSLITDANTPINGSYGTSEDAAAADLRWMLRAVGLTAESRPLWAMAPDVAVAALSLAAAGAVAFQNMSPTGGVLLGIPAMVTDALAAGDLALIDGAGLAGDAEGVKINSARHADIQLNDEPDSPATASTTTVNLWTNNLVGLKPEVFFGVERLRDNAYAKTTGVAWGSAPDSPA
jgi:HK97 family phage major capsid protein